MTKIGTSQQNFGGTIYEIMGYTQKPICDLKLGFITDQHSWKSELLDNFQRKYQTAQALILGYKEICPPQPEFFLYFGTNT
jgi:hypothetical protein